MLIESKKLEIGAHTYIRSGCVLSDVSSIGRFCSIGKGCIIGQGKRGHPTDWLSSHPFQYTNTGLSFTPEAANVTIGNDVWIGHDAMILEGVSIGTGAIIATRALVTRDVPPYAIVAGAPANIVRFRHAADIIVMLVNSKWWNCDIKLLKNLPLNDPKNALSMLGDSHKENPARYKKIELTRNKFVVLH
ncbi:antibiotic acetyltransferase [Pseudomonas arsenicoxydans]|uniref:Chloramphenicol acetyltransferase n=1 Tax=Pseudomonas arsenicoxydans TaxID=702115 RepID=A0A502HNU4_9PSED|nr:antibiotic acetyltransferase [Pseudomonas arsenicoxydans]